MKKLIFILVFGLISIITYSQSTMKSYDVITLSGSKWSFAKTPGAGDSLGVYQDSIQIPILLNSIDSLKGFFRVKLKEVTSPARIIVQVQSKKYSLADYTTRTTITYTGVGTDSTIYVKTLAPYLSDPYVRLLFIRSANKAYIEDVSGWFFK